jgi:hypothetical protein
VGAAALRVVHQAVVAAGDFIAIKRAHGERQQPVPAGVFQRGHAAVQLAEHHQLLLADGARQQLAGDFHVIRSGVPGIQGERGFFGLHEYAVYT